MGAVCGVPARFPQFLHHDLVGGEIADLWEPFAEFFGGQYQRGFAHLVAVRPVGQVPDGAHRQNPPFLRMAFHDGGKQRDGFIDAQPFVGELPGGDFVKEYLLN